MVGRRLVLIAALALLAGCSGQEEGRVDPRDYDAFFLWAGVKPQPVLTQAKEVYLLAGEVRSDDPERIVPLRATPRIHHARLWLVIRTERLDWGEGVCRQLDAELVRWAMAGNRVEGVQVDFDAATHGLDRYNAFLAGFRRCLPSRYRLSITGLMDWSVHGDPAELSHLSGIVDEVVVQTYQGRSTIPGYERYIERLAQLPVPHKLALVEGGKWRAPPALARDAAFRGYVVFLVNDAGCFRNASPNNPCHRR